MPFKVNCENCEDLLVRGEIYNYKGRHLCEDCYVLVYLFDPEAPNAILPDEKLGSVSQGIIRRSVTIIS